MLKVARSQSGCPFRGSDRTSTQLRHRIEDCCGKIGLFSRCRSPLNRARARGRFLNFGFWPKSSVLPGAASCLLGGSLELAIICRSYGADRDLDAGSYKDFAPTEHALGLPNVQTAGRRLLGGSALAREIFGLKAPVQQGDVKQDRQSGGGCQQLVIPFPPCDRGHNHRKGEEHVKT